MNDNPLTVQASRRGRPFLKIVLLVAVIAGACAIVFAPREPSARGHSLSHWLRVAVEDVSVTDGTWPTNAHAAIKEIGPAAIPVLLGKLRAREGLREKMAPSWNYLVQDIAPGGWQDTLKIDLARALRVRGQSVEGFKILGTNAAPAVPALRELLKDERHVTEQAIACLKYIQTDDALAALIPMLSHSNPRVRTLAVPAVAAFDERAVRAGEQFAALANDQDEDAARTATRYVGDLLPAERAIPLLLDRLKDARPRVVRSAIRGFYGRGAAAEAAMPNIATLFNSRDQETRKYATNVLANINPDRASEFGVETNGMSATIYRVHEHARQRLTTNTSPWRSW